MKVLPVVTPRSEQYAGCCLSISEPLLQTIVQYLPSYPGTTASIGCGDGLLEGILTRHGCGFQILGIEVHGKQIPYLPPSSCRWVPGTWAVWDQVHLTAAWMWVYPRDLSLFQKYLDWLHNHETRQTQTIVWLGPRADAKEYADLMQTYSSDWTQAPLEQQGMPTYECILVWLASNPSHP